MVVGQYFSVFLWANDFSDELRLCVIVQRLVVECCSYVTKCNSVFKCIN